MSYYAKISRKGGSLKKLFLTKPDPYDNETNFCCVEDISYRYEFDNNQNYAELKSEDDLFSAWTEAFEEAEEG